MSAVSAESPRGSADLIPSSASQAPGGQPHPRNGCEPCRLRAESVASRRAVSALPGGPRLGRPGLVELLRRLPPGAGRAARRPPRLRSTAPPAASTGSARQPRLPPTSGTGARGPDSRSARCRKRPRRRHPPRRLRPGERWRQARPRDPPARRRRAHGRQHGGQPDGADRDQRPRRSGQAADRQPDRDQQSPGARPRRQDLLHPPDRLRGRARAGGRAGDELLLRRGRRQADARAARARSTWAWPSTCARKTARASSWCRASRTRRPWTSASSGWRTRT